MQMKWVSGMDSKGDGAEMFVKPEFTRMNSLRFGGDALFVPSVGKLAIVGLLVTGAIVFTAVGFSSLYASQSAAVDAKPGTLVVEKPAQIAMVDALVPVQTIEAGKALDPSLFMRVKRPQSAMPIRAITNLADLRGQYARVALPSGVPLMGESLTTVRPRNPVVNVIPTGFRAATISVDLTTAAEGWARAGTRVDVAWVSDILGEKSSTVIVQNVKVLSAERQVESAENLKSDAPVPTTVTLLASERDSQRIILAAASGKLILMLRGSEDSGKQASAPGALTYKDLVSGGHAKDLKPGVQGYVRIGKRSHPSEELVLLANGKLVRGGENR